MDITETILTIIASLGGGTAIIWAFSTYFSKIWADKYVESVRAINQKILEDYKNELQLSRESISRYSTKQFELYSQLYHSLCDLKNKADDLWDKATPDKLRRFSMQLKKTKREVEKSYLFLEMEHYNKLQYMFDQFSEFENGKKSLLSIREESFSGINDHLIEEWISFNRQRKKEYDEFIRKIGEDFRNQIRGTP
jgi:hypothetical protein